MVAGGGGKYLRRMEGLGFRYLGKDAYGRFTVLCYHGIAFTLLFLLRVVLSPRRIHPIIPSPCCVITTSYSPYYPFTLLCLHRSTFTD